MTNRPKIPTLCDFLSQVFANAGRFYREHPDLAPALDPDEEEVAEQPAQPQPDPRRMYRQKDVIRPLPEGFRPIPGYPGYGIDRKGNVFGKRGRLLKPDQNGGYLLIDANGRMARPSVGAIMQAVWPEAAPAKMAMPADRPKQTARHEAKSKPQAKPKAQAKMRRKCHDCGKPTADYRCPECWKKLLRELE